jgi:hypothetical protein
MGSGPISAVEKALARAGLTVEDLDVVELNEAFGAVGAACSLALGLDPEKVNPNGGAIALGHPLGASGAILAVKLMYELERRQGRYGVVTLCVGRGRASPSSSVSVEETAVRVVVYGSERRVGILEGDNVVDVEAAYVKLAHEVQNHPAPYRTAGATTPADLEAFIQLGDRALEGAGNAVDYLMQRAGDRLGPRGEANRHPVVANQAARRWPTAAPSSAWPARTTQTISST